ncbi:MAG: hypothetical protein G3M70_14950 [Candidatus Nitronauta litoralis]|uniref:Uncharacterized protein n=1 Tax=Candidatus Nitronauta litoralis TaxID=2705533 RepID=A0A7T0BYB0_9BACT|nr:MAG: hypothetical protein G3M70_14950 [Candidatus Nitronauta litoralis]
MEQGDPMEEHYSRLSDAIMKAISNSPEISKLLTELKEKGLITPESYFNFILSLEELSTLLEIPSYPENLYKLEPSKESDDEEILGENIEKSGFSENEMRFEEYYRKMFDEKEWLRKARLKF